MSQAEPLLNQVPLGTIALDSLLDAVRQQLAHQVLPEATYRLQFNGTFTFRDAAALVPYLAVLGISHCYVSPYLKAVAGSMHGYDIVDHATLNPEIGTEEEYEQFVQELHVHGMGQILDVVPNHMGVASHDNAWWTDVLENGPSSPYASFFDIDWMPLKPGLADKVLLPVLSDQFGKVLEDQQIVLHFEDGTFFVSHNDRRFPIAVQSSATILKYRIEKLVERLGAEHPHLLEFQSILTAISHLPPRTESDVERINEGRREREVIKRRLNDLCQASPEVREFLAENVRAFNGTRGDPRSFDLLDQLLLDQAYRLSYWRVAADEINYRRFFDVNELAAVCMENPLVFELAHALILRLVVAGKVDGLRVDHPDGLYDPTDYLLRLQRRRFLQLCRQTFESGQYELSPSPDAPRWEDVEPLLAARWEAARFHDSLSPLARPLHLLVEKILGRGERLPEDWPVHGTTGYEFLNTLNGLFVDTRNARAFDAIYTRFVRERTNYSDLVYRCKRLIMLVSMSSEISVLGHQLDRISEQNRWSRDFTLNSLTRALREVIACFPVYRTYIGESGVPERDRHYVEAAVARAKRKNPAMSAAVFDLVHDILLLKYPENADDAARVARRRFVGKFQQVTSPVMAMGVEDTAFYIYNRLVSLNEVGGDPERFGTSVAAFHQQNLERQASWPHALLATSTHDNKRSEDVRARINILSEIPQEWKARLVRWARWNQRKKTKLNGDLAPSRNDEYLLYQTLIGTWPLEPLSAEGREAFVGRIYQYMLKAAREAKVETSWISPHEPYERAMQAFVSGLLADTPKNVFLAEFLPLARQVANCGIWNSLSQTLLKLTAPGVPDLYQGTELWDFSLVDPDNRRPVDYELRSRLMASIQLPPSDPRERNERLSQELIQHPSDGRIKMYVTRKTLNLRRARPGLCTTGAYVPLDASGARADHVCAFARRAAGHIILVVVPRLVAQLTALSGEAPLGEGVWQDTLLRLPSEVAGRQLCNVLTREEVTSSTDASCTQTVRLAELFRTMPLALLELVP